MSRYRNERSSWNRARVYRLKSEIEGLMVYSSGTTRSQPMSGNRLRVLIPVHQNKHAHRTIGAQSIHTYSTDMVTLPPPELHISISLFERWVKRRDTSRCPPFLDLHSFASTFFLPFVLLQKHIEIALRTSYLPRHQNTHLSCTSLF